MVEGARPSASRKRPKVTVNADEATVVAIKLARLGYGSGDPQKVLEFPADIVIAILQYEQFQVDYEEAYIDMNKDQR